jgi:LmbE family N-acetylglucosaminyl deacetylase
MSRTVVVAPHPDDEVLGCSAVLRNSSVTVVHVTDGVPPWTPVADRDDLAAQRGVECVDAWALLWSQVDRVQLGFGDLAAWQVVDEIADSLAGVIGSRITDEVYLPAYQGGHPDHDASYLAGALARQMLGTQPLPAWWVYGLYGFDDTHRLRFGWLPPGLYASIEIRGDDAGLLATKAEALGRFASQVWHDSALDLWIRDPVPEQFAPLPAIWDRLPELPCFYDEELGFGRHGASATAVESAFRTVLTPRSGPTT